jgi:hypothetical protein
MNTLAHEIIIDPLTPKVNNDILEMTAGRFVCRKMDMVVEAFH